MGSALWDWELLWYIIIKSCPLGLESSERTVHSLESLYRYLRAAHWVSHSVLIGLVTRHCSQYNQMRILRYQWVEFAIVLITVCSHTARPLGRTQRSRQTTGSAPREEWFSIENPTELNWTVHPGVRTDSLLTTTGNCADGLVLNPKWRHFWTIAIWRAKTVTLIYFPWSCQTAIARYVCIFR